MFSMNWLQVQLPLLMAPNGEGTGAIERGFSLVQALPGEAHAAMGLMLLVGLALWLFGGRLVKPMFAILGLALGGVVGLIVLPAIGIEQIDGAPGTWVGMAIGAVIGLVLALVMLKVALVFAAGLAFAVAGFLGGTVYLQYNPLPSDSPPALTFESDAPRDPSGRRLFTNPYTGEQMTIDELTRSLRDVRRSLGEAGTPAGDAPPENGGLFDRADLEAIAVRCRAVIAEASDAVRGHWNALSPRERFVVLGSTLGSMALGLLVGFFLPKRTTAGVTALAGSAIWLSAGVWLIDALAPQYSGMTDLSPQTWGVIWVLVFLVGLVAQLSGLGRSGKKPAKGDDDGDG